MCLWPSVIVLHSSPHRGVFYTKSVIINWCTTRSTVYLATGSLSAGCDGCLYPLLTGLITAPLPHIAYWLYPPKYRTLYTRWRPSGLVVISGALQRGSGFKSISHPWFWPFQGLFTSFSGAFTHIACLWRAKSSLVRTMTQYTARLLLVWKMSLSSSGTMI